MKFLFSLCFCLLCLPAAAGELLSRPADQTGLSLTIYNRNLALIRDRRQVVLPAGEQALAIRGVSGQLQPETALLEAVDGKGLKVLEQNFNYDLLTPRKLLEKYLGRTIGIIRTNPATGKETRERATVLGIEEGLVVRIGDRIETDPGGRLVFRDIPASLRDQPTLVTRLRVEQGGRRELQLTYLSGGLSWKADYVARLDESDRHIELAGWVTLENHSGTAYPDARLQLVAGEVNRVSRAMRRAPPFEMMATKAAPAPDMEEETLFDYHLYTLQRPTTLLDRQTKQVALLDAASVPVRREYLLQGRAFYYRSRLGSEARKLPVETWLIFDNRAQAGLGLPLPAGIVRVYKGDRRGNLQFLGEDRIRHTPRNETVRLKLGESFDITAHRTQTAFHRRNTHPPYDTARESSYRIELKNAREEAVEVLVREPVPGDWKLTAANIEPKRLDAHTLQWKIGVPAGGSTVLEYSVLVRE